MVRRGWREGRSGGGKVVLCLLWGSGRRGGEREKEQGVAVLESADSIYRKKKKRESKIYIKQEFNPEKEKKDKKWRKGRGLTFQKGYARQE